MKSMKRYLAMIMSVLMVINSVQIPVVYADGDPAQIEFVVTDEQGQDVTLPADASLLIADQASNPVTGVSSLQTSSILFTPDSALTAEETYVFVLTASGYQEASGQFSGSETSVAVVITPELPTGNLQDPELSVDTVNLLWGETAVLSDYVHFNAAYDGEPEYSIKTGTDIVEVSSGVCTALKNGDAVVTVTLPETGLFSRAEADISVSVSNKKLGDAFRIEPDTLTLQYGQTKDIASMVVLPPDYAGAVEYTITSGVGIIDLTGTTVKVVGIGNATVTVTAPSTDLYGEAEKDLTIVADPIDLGELTSAHITWDAASRVYDQTRTVSVTGHLQHPNLLAEDQNITISATARCTSADVGVYQAVITDIELNLPLHYKYTIGDAGVTQVEVTPLDVDLSVVPVTIMYGNEEWVHLQTGEVFLTHGMEYIDFGSLSDTLIKELKTTYENSSLRINGYQTYPVGTFNNAVELVLEKTTSNSNFGLIKVNPASLIVTREVTDNDTALWQRIRLNEEDSFGYYKTSETLYIGRSGKAVFFVQPGSLYDSVAIKPGSNGYSNTIHGSSQHGPIIGTFYLYDQTNQNTRTDADPNENGAQDNIIPDNAVFIDAQGPDISMQKEGTDAVSSGNGQIEVFVGGAKDSDITISVSDADSGIEKAAYALYKYTPGVPAPDVNTIAQSVSWRSFTDSITVNLSTLTYNLEGIYTIIVMAEDRVGNVSYSLSKLTLIDTTTPSVSLQGVTKDTIYNTDVPYTFKAWDKDTSLNDGVASGIKQITVTVTVDGKQVDDGSVSAEPYTNTYTITEEMMYDRYGVAAPITPEDMGTMLSEFIFRGVVLKEINGNTVTLTIKVTDRADNSTYTGCTFSIDSIAPVGTIYYDNNNVDSEKYFKAERKLTLMIVERSFDPDDVILTLNVDGTNYSKPVSEWISASVPGVAFYSFGQLGGATPDDVVWFYEFRLGEAGVVHSYKVKAYMKDNAGNKTDFNFKGGTVAGSDFVIDRVAPTTHLTFRENGDLVAVGTSESGRTYHRNPITVTASVTERSFVPERIVFTLIQTDSQGNTVTVYDASVLNSGSNLPWVTSQGSEYTASLPVFDGYANYTLTMQAIDAAGNTSAKQYVYFTVDNEAPAGSIEVVGSGSFDDLSGTAAFRIYSKNGVEAVINAEDLASGLKSVKYCIYTPVPSASSSFTVPFILDDLEQLPWTDVTTVLSISPNAQAIIYARLEDKCGNITFLNTKDGIICDNIPPVITFADDDNTKIYNKSLKISFSANDAENGGTYAGIKDMGYRILKDGVVTQEGSFAYAFADETARIQEYTAEVTINATKNNSNDVLVEVFAVDYAGNETTASRAYHFDTTAPKLEVSYDRNDPVNEKYFTETRTMTLTIKERNFAEENLVFPIVINGTSTNYSVAELMAGKADGVRLTKGADSEAGKALTELTDSRTVTYTIEFGTANDADTEYTIDIQFADVAGNKAGTPDYGSSTPKQNFVIDKTVPVISFVDPEQTGVAGGDIKVTVLATDGHSMSAAANLKEIRYTITANGRETQNGYTDAPDTQGGAESIRSFIIEAAKNNTNDIVVEVTATDYAGNSYTINRRFYIDTTSPVIMVNWDNDGVVNGDYYPQARKGSITITERNYDEETANITVVRNGEENTYTIAALLSGTQTDIKLSKIEDTQEGKGKITLTDEREISYAIVVGDPDGLDVDYEITVNNTDIAGNKASGAREFFTIDKTVPTLSITDTSGAALVNGNVTITITASDGRTQSMRKRLQKIEVTVFCDDEPSQTILFDALDSDEAKGDVIREFVIDSLINNSNDVRIEVVATDYAGHTFSVSKAYMLDITAPFISLVSADEPENGLYFKQERTIEVIVTERNFDEGMMAFSLSVDGVTGTYSVQDLLDNKAASVRMVRGIDTEASSQKHTDKRQIHYTLYFGEEAGADHDFTLYVSTTDIVGNKSSGMDTSQAKAAADFVVDRTAPSLQFTSPAVELSNTDVTVDFASGDNAQAHTHERLMECGYVIYTGGQETARRSFSDFATEEKMMAEMQRSFVIDASENNSNHIQVEVYAVDYAGNRTVINRDYAIDTIAPDISLIWDMTVPVQGSYYDKERTATLTITERNFSEDKVSFTVTVNGNQGSYSVTDLLNGMVPGVSLSRGEDSQAGAAFVSLSDSRTIRYNLGFGEEADADYDFDIDVSVSDNAGNNAASLGTDAAFTVDKTVPSIGFDNTGATTVVASSIPVSFIANDNAAGKTRARLQSIQYTVKADGNITQQGSFDDLRGDESVDENVSRSVTIDAQLNNSNDIELIVTVFDYAGHSTTITHKYMIDITAPTISVSYDKNDPVNGRYFNEARTMTATITERNFDENLLVFVIGIDGNVKNYSASELLSGAADGIAVIQRSSSPISGTVPTDEHFATYVLTFGAGDPIDHDYDVDIKVTDLTGNQSGAVQFGTSNPGPSFTIDRIAPALTATILKTNGEAVTVGRTESERTFLPYHVVPHVRVVERNHSDSGMILEISGTNAYGAATGLSSLWVDAWNHSGYTHSGTAIRVNEDANYVFSASYTDLAGNKVEVSPFYFTVDTIAPTGKITVQAGGESGEYGTYSASAIFKFITNQVATLSQQADDETSGIASVSYWVHNPDPESRGEFNGVNLDALKGMNFTVWSGILELALEQQAIVYARIVDKAGNTTYISTSDGIIIDKTSPLTPAITIRVGDDNTIHNGDTPFSIVVTDPLANGTYAGLRSVEWEVLNGGTVTQSGSYNSELANPAARVREIEKQEIVTAAINNSNHVLIRVTATDYAGNSASAEKALRIDMTAPKVEIIYDSNNGLEGRYYKDARTATVRITERNFNPEHFESVINTVLGGRAQLGTWDLSGLMGESDDAVSTIQIRFHEDDDYDMEVFVTDMAGNSAVSAKTELFTIDRTVPVVEIRFDNNEAKNGKYFNKIRTATFTVTERNFNPEAFVMGLVATLNGEPVNIDTSITFKQKDSAWVASIKLPEDADYELSASLTDRAGNGSDTVYALPFTIDTTPPDLVVEGIEDRQAYNGDITPVIRFSDINAGSNIPVITLTGLLHETATINGDAELSERGGVVTVNNIEVTREADDIYTLRVVFSDLAGNETVRNISFSINRFGSNFSFDNATTRLTNEFYRIEPQDIVVIETNVDPLTHQSISVGVNGVVRELVKGVDYLVEEDTEDPWKIYRYTILASNFEQEGVYEIIISSVDAAGNMQDNKLKEAPISFAIDKTNPTCIITGIESGAHYNDTSKTFTVNASDNLAVSTVYVYANGVLVKEFSAQEIAELGGKLPVTVGESNDYQYIKAVARDAAGNEIESDDVRILVSTNGFIRFYRNTPLFLGSLAGLVCLGGGLWFILWRRRKKDEEEKTAGNAATDDLLDPAKKGAGKTEDIAPKH